MELPVIVKLEPYTMDNLALCVIHSVIIAHVIITNRVARNAIVRTHSSNHIQETGAIANQAILKTLFEHSAGVVTHCAKYAQAYPAIAHNVEETASSLALNVIVTMRIDITIIPYYRNAHYAIPSAKSVIAHYRHPVLHAYPLPLCSILFIPANVLLATITMLLQKDVNYAIHYEHNAMKDQMTNAVFASYRL